MDEGRINTAEKAVLVGLGSGALPPEQSSDEECLEELAALLETAGGECVAKVLQQRDRPDPRTLIGQGKLREVRELAENLGAELILFDNELSASQIRAIEKDVGIRVIDRSNLILDIFAQRARTSEGRLQVELAQYKYILPRLTGMWSHLVRQTASGGKSPIGTRGPGETQLETDRRHIRKRIQILESELERVRRIRAVQRGRRIKNEIPVVALVGYTNAGKSSLLNALTGACVEANDRLFDTLDTTTRRLTVSDTLEVLLSDTVGFIRKLPHHLVEAFRATLEELRFADLLLHVIDASDPEWPGKSQVVYSLIRQLGAENIPHIEVFNKADLVPVSDVPMRRGRVMVSAKEGSGLDKLLPEIESALSGAKKRVNLRIPYKEARVIENLYREAQVNALDYKDDYIEADITCTPKAYGLFKKYLAGELPDG